MRKLLFILFLLPFSAISQNIPQIDGIIFLLFDDAGLGDFRAYNKNSLAKTPNFNAAAQNGLLCRTFISEQVCSVARLTALSNYTASDAFSEYGLSNYGFDGHNWKLDDIGHAPLYRSIFTEMAAAGWVTGHFGKWHLGHTTGVPGRWGINVVKGRTWTGGDKYEAHSTITTLSGSTTDGVPDPDEDSDGEGKIDYWKDGLYQRLPNPSPKILVRITKSTTELKTIQVNGQDVTVANDTPNPAVKSALYSDYVDDVFTTDAIDFMQTCVNNNQKFFAYLPLTDPHGVFDIPLDSLQMKLAELWPDLATTRPNITDWHGELLTCATRAWLIDEHMDKNIGRVVNFINAQGTNKNILLLVSSDNGGQNIYAERVLDKQYPWLPPGSYCADNDTLLWGKGRHSAGGNIVPTLWYCPNLITPRVSSDVHGLADLFPTFTTLARGFVRPPYRGKDLTDFLFNNGAPPYLNDKYLMSGGLPQIQAGIQVDSNNEPFLIASDIYNWSQTNQVPNSPRVWAINRRWPTAGSPNQRDDRVNRYTSYIPMYTEMINWINSLNSPIGYEPIPKNPAVTPAIESAATIGGRLPNQYFPYLLQFNTSD